MRHMSQVMSPPSDRTCGPCTKASDNKHFDCPPRMADGRLFTDYRSRCDINFMTMTGTTTIPKDSYTYRQYLISHADDLIAEARKNAYIVAACAPCVHPSTMLPEKISEICDTHTCIRVPGPDPLDGLGTGRIYGGEDGHPALRDMQQRDRAVTSSVNCCASPFDVANYYADGTPMLRLTNPGGAPVLPLQGGDPSVAPPFGR